MALVEGYDEPWGSHSIKGAAKKYHFTEQQILDSIDNNEPLIIEGGLHALNRGLGKTTDIKLAGLKVTFSWKHKVTEEDKDKLLAMKNLETQSCGYTFRLVQRHGYTFRLVKRRG